MSEMWITKNDVTGETSLKPKDDNQRQRDLSELFHLNKENTHTEDFIPPRNDAWAPDPFADWDLPEED